LVAFALPRSQRLAELDDLAKSALSTSSLLLQSKHKQGSSVMLAGEGALNSSFMSTPDEGVTSTVEGLLNAWQYQRPDASDPPEVMHMYYMK
jgi:hypothetical protein